jgi:hypothetical protein
MDKHTMRAFEKLQKREHLLRVLNDRLARGIITPEEFEKEQTSIFVVTELTDEERRAYRQYNSRSRKSK